MNILVIDDDDGRHEVFEKYLTQAGHTVLHAFDAEETMSIIGSCKEPIGMVCFDHDLGEDSKNGSQLATDILNLPIELWPARVVIHSNNHQGALNIISKFTSAKVLTEYRPFDGAAMMKRLVEDLVEQ